MTKEEAIARIQDHMPDSCYSMLREAVDIAIEALKVQKVGHWIAKRDWLCITHACSNCNKEFEDVGETQAANYCPICGARMEK